MFLTTIGLILLYFGYIILGLLFLLFVDFLRDVLCMSWRELFFAIGLGIFFGLWLQNSCHSESLVLPPYKGYTYNCSSIFTQYKFDDCRCECDETQKQFIHFRSVNCKKLYGLCEWERKNNE